MALGIAGQAPGYVFLLDETNCVSTWPAGTIPLQVKLATTPTLTDGSNYRSSVIAAMASWNVHLGTVQFAGNGAAPSAYAIGDGISEIAMDTELEVEEERFPFDAYTLAITISYEEANFVRESDIIFNSNHEWDSFRGGQFGAKHDIRRVAAHELGHVLGLGHPDEADPPQYGAVLMHSVVLYGPSIEGPQQDDIAGAQALYGAPGFVPQNDNFLSAENVALTAFNETAVMLGTNVAATSEAGEPQLDVDDPGGRTVWWKWTATSSGIVTLTTAGSNFDTLLGAYTGTSVGSLTQRALNDDVESGVIRHSAITFNVDFGTTYYLAVDGWGGRVGTIQLNMSFALDPERAPPTFSSRPFARNAIVGQATVLAFEVESQFPVSFSWTKNGVPLSSQTTGTLALASAATHDSGIFEVVATSIHGATRSLARLKVVHDDMTAVVWRQGYLAASAIPVGMGSLLAVSAGGDHVLVVKADGTVAAWGDNYRRQLDVPVGLSDVVEVAAGTEFSLALRVDGKVFAWGDVMHGGGATEARVIPPADLDQVISIAAHGKWAMALRADGSVVTWGEMVGFKPDNIGVAYAVSAGPAHGHAIRRDGSVVSWGDYSGDGYPTPAGVGSLSAISAGGTLAAGHSVALRRDGTVAAWGYNYYGQTNVPAGLTDAVGVAAGGTFSLALRSNGKVIGWGTGFLGALEIPPELEEAVSISAGYNFGVALVRSQPPAIVINPADTVVQVADTVSLTVGATGSRDLFYQWKKNGTNLTDSERMTGSLTDTLRIASALTGDTGDYLVEVTNLAGVAESTPARLTVLSPPEIIHRSPSRLVHEGEEVSFSVSVGGGGPFTFSWSHNRRLIEGATNSSILIGGATIADAGYYEVTITNSEGGASTGVFYLTVAIDEPSIVSWGNPPAATPTIGGPIAAISCDTFAVALKGDGTVVAWGDNGYGQATVPAGLVDAVAVSAGSEFAIALKSDGTVLGWGRNDAGQATPPPGLGDVVAVSAGLNHALALKANGSVVAWGDPYEGNTVVPAGLRGVVAVEAGNTISFALKSDGTIVTWGFNGYLEPYPPVGLSNVVGVASGSSQHLALKSDGTVVTWGFAYGEDTSAPAGLSNVDAVAAGYGFDLALTSGGRVVGWGANSYGEATPPEGLSTVVAIAAGRNWGLALTRLELPKILAQPPEVAVVTGDIAQLSVSVSGSIPMAFQWRKNGVILVDGNGISDATSPTLWIDPVKGSDAGQYDVVISNPAGSLVSAPMTLNVTLSPVFTTRPLSRLVAAGEAVTFAALAIDSEDVHYQWRRHGRDIPGATSPTLTLSSVSYPDGGYYEIVASNSAAASRSVFHLDVGPVGGPGLSIAPWGESPDNGFGPTNVPSGLGDVVGMASGSRHSLALQAGGTVAAWGEDSGGSTKVPTGLSEVVQVAAGEHHSLALL
ncbi:MAG TPA: immunoglobulin domain-containing protein, partial [Opitutaceae bacterium]|nr:immunoglobulin domain-containing protein [Opitutaceae bacterium]